tara:strand:- start:2758 stop:3615 length:858 start_codon:yes stop_codon:yes gene_type:complete
MISFHQVKVVNEFKKKKIIFKKKKNEKPENLEKDEIIDVIIDNVDFVNLEKEEIIDRKTEIVLQTSIKQKKTDYINDVFKELDLDSYKISEEEKLLITDSNHYIGLIILNCIGMNELHKIKSQCNVNLYNTSIYTRNLKYYPLFKIDNEILDDNFKYKKYIRNLLSDNYSIEKDDIINIKLYNTNYKLHNYIVLIKNKNIDNGISYINFNLHTNRYSWNTRIDFYNADNDSDLNQKDIYSKILNSKDFNIDKNFTLFPDSKDIIPNYIKYNKILYVDLIKLLAEI